jgi:hypothetical protein
LIRIYSWRFNTLVFTLLGGNTSGTGMYDTMIGTKASADPMNTRFILMILLFASLATAVAAPAPWYWWRSKLDGKTICTQTNPGIGWERVSGPFRDAQCEQLIPPVER